jgi:hypothetical protein
MAITLRGNKSQALTHDELDGNFTDLDTRVTSNKSTLDNNVVKSVNTLTPSSGAITLDTDDIGEGSTNLYFTNARADARINAAGIQALSDVDYTGTPTVNHVLTWDGDSWISASPPGLGGGEANDGNNIGTGAEVFSSKVGQDLQFRTIIGTAPIVATQNTNDITLTWVPNADVDANTQKIINVVDPASAQDAATKNYVDTTSLLLAGGTMSGAIEMGTSKITGMGDPTSAQDAATKNYVDTTSLLLAGGTMTGKITLDGSPTNTLHAATKGYVDSALSSGTNIFTISDGSGTDPIATGDTLTFSGTANQINTSIGSNSVTLSFPSDVTIPRNLTIGGDLVVTGTTLTVNEANLSIADQYIYLNSANAGTAVFSGSGLNDAVFTGYYEGAVSDIFSVRIDGTGGTDTFEWSRDEFATTEATDIPITGSAQLLADNISVTFAATTGHTSGDLWQNTVAPVAQDIGFWGNENNGTGKYGYTHVGIFYDQSDRTWKAVNNYKSEPEGNINLGDLGFEFAPFEAAEFITGSLTVSGTEIKTTLSNQSLELAANGTGTIQLQSDTLLTAQQELRFGDADSSNYVAFKAPTTVGSNVTWTLPSADAGVSGYALVSDSAGTLSWAAAGATVTQDNSTNTNFNLYFASTTSGALTAVKYDGADLLFNPSTSTLTCTNFAGQATSAQYADLAEIYASDREYPAGTVVTVGGDAEITKASPDTDYLAGVISTAPAYLMNSAADGEAVALVGRVPVRVVGNITKGMPVFATHNGCASANGQGPLVGIALETNSDLGEKSVECLLKV